MQNIIKVCLSPSLFPIYSDRKSIVVVVDILRATSAICTALDLGVKSIIPVSTIEDALDLKDCDNHILAAERNGKVVRGFDIGNSPTDYLNKDFQDKKMVLTTTNGTRAINIAKRDHQVVIGSFLNIDALTGYEKLTLGGSEYEAFNTSGGLGTFAKSLDGEYDSLNLNYKTLRRIGHHDYVDFLFNDFPINEIIKPEIGMKIKTNKASLLLMRTIEANVKIIISGSFTINSRIPKNDV